MTKVTFTQSSRNNKLIANDSVLSNRNNMMIATVMKEGEPQQGEPGSVHQGEPQQGEPAFAQRGKPGSVHQGEPQQGKSAIVRQGQQGSVHQGKPQQGEPAPAPQGESAMQYKVFEPPNQQGEPQQGKPAPAPAPQGESTTGKQTSPSHLDNDEYSVATLDNDLSLDGNLGLVFNETGPNTNSCGTSEWYQYSKCHAKLTQRLRASVKTSRWMWSGRSKRRSVATPFTLGHSGSWSFKVFG
jgi:hypothetical protein